MDGDKKWYVLNVKKEWKKKLMVILNRRKIENYCPARRVMTHSLNRIKFVDEPLFCSYTFIRISENEFEELKKTASAINFLYCLNQPAIISDSEIEAIKQFLKKYTGVKLERASVNVKDRLRMPGHLFVEHEDNVSVSKEKACKVMLPSPGYTMIARPETLNDTSHSYKINHELMADDKWKKLSAEQSYLRKFLFAISKIEIG